MGVGRGVPLPIWILIVVATHSQQHAHAQQSQDSEQYDFDQTDEDGTGEVILMSPGQQRPVARPLITAHNDQVCSTWGNFYFKTFDGEVFHFPGACNYLLASNCKDSYEDFNIQIRRKVEKNIPTISHITMRIQGEVVELTNDTVKVNNEVVQLPYSHSGVQVDKNGLYIQVIAKTGMDFQWNQEDAIMLELDGKFTNKTCGLCGDFNDIPKNEFMSNGFLMSPLQYGNLQKMNGPTEECEDLRTEPLNNCTDQVSTCEAILTGESFYACNAAVNVAPYIDACVQDLCRCNNESQSFCLCNTFTEYSRQCAHAGSKPLNWRTSELCPIMCPYNMVFEECSLPCVDTCSNPEPSQLCDEHCTDGCFCPKGTVFDDINNSGCIVQEECPCTFNGNTYATGTGYENTCHSCTCAGGKWNCSDLPCPGTCSVEGGSHISTFDETHYNFHGDCSYVLAKHCTDDSFNVMVELRKCGLSDTETCMKSVTVSLNGGDKTFFIKACGTVLMDMSLTQMPITVAGVTMFQPSSFYIIMDTDFGMQLEIQLIPTMQVRVRLQPHLEGKTCGLCGNYNKNQADDFRTMSGVVEGTGASFANNWKTQSDCSDIKNIHEDPCSSSIDNELYAQHWCEMLSDPDGSFADCHSTVNPSIYEKNCMFDTCNCEKTEDCMCAAISSYVRACAANGVALNEWRSEICDKYSTSCPTTQNYSYAVDTCQATCRSLSEPDPTCDIEFIAVDGCVCPEGTYMDENGECLAATECNCYYKGSSMTQGEVVYDNKAICTCSQGKLSCIGSEIEQPDCVAPMVYFDCAKANATAGSKGSECQKSCQTFDVECYSTHCVSGCVCPDGLVLDGKGSCIQAETCPCVHNEVYYQPGDTMKVSCNTCTCKNRMWDCTTKLCMGTCVVYGDGHYITFDSKRYDFDGDCEYTLAQDYCGNGNAGSFRVMTENLPCGTTGTTCSKSIKFYIGGYELIFRGDHIDVVERDSTVEVPYTIRSMGIYQVIEAKNGVVLMWDGKTSLFVKLTSNFQGKVCGLCGNYDLNGMNDYTTRSQSIVGDVIEFGNSWKASPNCPDALEIKDPCSSNPYRKSWAQKQCSIITSNAFSTCHSQVDPRKYYEACVTDACACDTGGDCECFCTAVASYAQACNEVGVCIHWRTPTICPLFCDFYNPDGDCEWHYKPCGAPCMKTCINPSGKCLYELQGLEGCYPSCPEERPYFDEESMSCTAACGCYDKQGNLFRPGDKVYSQKNCESCTCTMNGFKCGYDRQACFCEYDGKKYKYNEVIYRTGDSLGGCFIATCAVNGTIEREITECFSTTPSTTFNFTTSPPPSPVTTTPPVTTTVCVQELCSWTEWLNNNYPGDGPDNGEYETITNMLEKGVKVCKNPKDVRCRAKQYPDDTLEDLGQQVECSPTVGLICDNKDQFPPHCLDYEVSFECCSYVPCGSTTTISPSTMGTEGTNTRSTSTTTGTNTTPTTSTVTETTISPSTTTETTTTKGTTSSTTGTTTIPSTISETTTPSTTSEVTTTSRGTPTSTPEGKTTTEGTTTSTTGKTTATSITPGTETTTTTSSTTIIVTGTTTSPSTTSETSTVTETSTPSTTTGTETTTTTGSTTIIVTGTTTSPSTSPETTTVTETTIPLTTTGTETTTTTGSTTIIVTGTTTSPSTSPESTTVTETTTPSTTTGTEATTTTGSTTIIVTGTTTSPSTSPETTTVTETTTPSTTTGTETTTTTGSTTIIVTGTTTSPSTSPETSTLTETTTTPSTTTGTETTTTTGSTTIIVTGTTTSPSTTSEITAVPESTTTPSTTTVTETTSPVVTVCRPNCNWSKWFENKNPLPTENKDGENLTFKNIEASGETICAKSEKISDIECRATNFPDMDIADLGQNVKCNVTFGLVCNNADQTGEGDEERCYDYTMRVLCCDYSYCTTTTTVTTEGTTTSSTTTVTETSTPSTTTGTNPTTTTGSTTIVVTETTTSPSMTSETSTVTETTTPSTTTGTETTTTTGSTTIIITGTTTSPSTSPETSTVTETTTPSTTTGTEITTTTGTTTIIVTGATTSPSTSPETSTVTETTTPSTTTGTETTTTTGSTASIVTGTTTSPSTTSETTTVTETTTTPSTTTVTETTSPVVTVCKPNCNWSKWFENKNPLPNENKDGENLTFKNIEASGETICAKSEKISDIECRATNFPDTDIADLGQNVKCNVTFGLVCNNADQTGEGDEERCYDYTMRVLCCDYSYCTTTTTVTTEGTTTSSTTTITETSTPSTTTGTETTRTTGSTTIIITGTTTSPSTSPETTTGTETTTPSTTTGTETTTTTGSTTIIVTGTTMSPSTSPETTTVTETTTPSTTTGTETTTTTGSTAIIVTGTTTSPSTSPETTTDTERTTPSTTTGTETTTTTGSTTIIVTGTTTSPSTTSETTTVPESTTTPSTTTVTETTSPVVTVCKPNCNWSKWFENKNPLPTENKDGENLTFKNIEASGETICAKSEKISDIECRATNFPDTDIADLGQNVRCNVTFGLVCNNADQTGEGNEQRCYDYTMRVLCCDYSYCTTTTTVTTEGTTTSSTTTVTETSTPSTTTGSKPTTTTGSTTIVVTETTTSPSTTSETSTVTETTTPSTTTGTETTTTTGSTTIIVTGTTTSPSTTSEITTVPESTTTPSTTTVTETTSPVVTVCKPNCNWSKWFENKNPLPTENKEGENLTFENIEASGETICSKSEKISDIECRATDFPDTDIDDLGQNVKCNVTFGLVCNDADQTGEGDEERCYDYTMRVLCCDYSYCTTTTTVTTEGTATSSTTTVTETSTPSTTTGTNPTTTTGSTTIVVTGTTTSPATTSETSTVTETTTPSTTTGTETTTTTGSTTIIVTGTTTSPSTSPETSTVTETTTPSTTTGTETTTTTGSTTIIGTGTTTSPLTTSETTTVAETTTPSTTTGTETTTTTGSTTIIGTGTTTSPLTTSETTTVAETTTPSTTTGTETTTTTGSTTIIVTGTTTSPSTSPETSTVTETTTPSTTTGTETTTTTGSTTIIVTGTITSPSTTSEITTVPESTTTPSTTTVTETTSPVVTVCKPKCNWSKWFENKSPLPTENEDGENLTFENIEASGETICSKSEKISDIECRATDFPDTDIADLGQNVMCNVTFGLVCNNADQTGEGDEERCYDYTMRVLCCDYSYCTTTTTVTTEGTTTSSTTTVTETSTPSTTTGSKPTTTTGSTTIVVTETTTSPSTTSETSTVTETTTPSTTTGTETTTTTGSTTIIVTGTTTSPSTTSEITTVPESTTTPSTTTVTETTSPVVTVCKPNCNWSKWFENKNPLPTESKEGENLTFENIEASGETICSKSEKISDIECRATDFPDTDIDDLGQNVKCNVTFGLVCNNADQTGEGDEERCYDYTMRVLCCDYSYCTTTTTVTTEGTTTSSTTTVTETSTPSTTTGTNPTTTTGSTTIVVTETTTSPSTTSETSTVTETTTPLTTTGTETTTTTGSTTIIVTGTTTSPSTTSETSTVTETTSPSTTTGTETTTTTGSTIIIVTETTTSPSTSPQTITVTETTTPSTTTGTETTTTTGSTTIIGTGTTTSPLTTSETTTVAETTTPSTTTGTETTTTSGTTSGVTKTPTAPSTTETETPSTEETTSITTGGTPTPSTTETTSITETTTTSTTTSTETTTSVVTLSSTTPGTTTITPVTSPETTGTPTTTVRTPSTPPTTGEISATTSHTVTTSCYCKVNDTLVPPGGVLYNTTDKAGCTFYATCSETCQPERFQGPCTTTVPTPAGTTTPSTSGSSTATTSTPSTSGSLTTTTPPSTAWLQTTVTSPSTSVLDRCDNVMPPRQINETWEINKCANATCENGGNITIKQMDCPTVKQVTCESGLEPKKVYDKTGCCFQYECETCVGPDGKSKMPGETWTSNCQQCACDKETITVKCAPMKCAEPPPPTCNKEGYELVKELVPDNPCCTKRECKCNPRLCSPEVKRCQIGFRLSSIIEDGDCCATMQCVPEKVCVFQNITYQPGAPIPQSKDSCKVCDCSHEMNPQTKLFDVICKDIVCQTDCAPGFDYTMKAGECCGVCEQKACVMNTKNNDTKVIEVGESWYPDGDNCTYYECDEVQGQITSVTVKRACEVIQPEDCTSGIIELTPDGCCEVCKEPRVACKTEKQPTVLAHGVCNTTVDLAICEGLCSSSSIFSSMSNAMEHKCTCCQELKTSKQEAQLSCPDGSSIGFSYISVEECGCVGTVCVPQEGAQLTDEMSRRRRRR